MKAKVAYPVASSHPAVWVRYSLATWTEKQLTAALAAYGTNWKKTEANVAFNLATGGRGPVVYQDRNGCVAYKNTINELVIYAPSFYSELRQQIAATEAQKKAVPRF